MIICEDLFSRGDGMSRPFICAVRELVFAMRDLFESGKLWIVDIVRGGAASTSQSA